MNWKELPLLVKMFFLVVILWCSQGIIINVLGLYQNYIGGAQQAVQQAQQRAQQLEKDLAAERSKAKGEEKK